MKPIPFILSVCSLCSVGILTGCAESLPLKVGVCQDNICAHIETVIPARKGGKEVHPVQ
jgi:hypothetical protein